MTNEPRDHAILREEHKIAIACAFPGGAYVFECSAALSGGLRMKQIARTAKGIAVAVALCAAAYSTANALGPLAGPAGATQADRQVSPESCLACERAADWKGCHQAALALAMEREWTRAIAV